MISPKKKLLALLLPLLLMTACASSRPPLVIPPAQIPPPPPELMEPEDLSQSYSEIVRKLLQAWQVRLTDWKAKS